MSFNCDICKKEYKSYKTLWSHNKNIHVDMNIYISNKIRNFSCSKCNKKFTRKDTLIYHNINTCKNKYSEDKIIKLEKVKIIKDNVKTINELNPINNQLINIIMDKNKIIEELKNNKKENISNNEIIKEPIIEFRSLTINNVIIISRIQDNFINATQLCKAGDRNFNDWFILETTKELFNKNELIEINKDENNQEIWIDPKLAVQLAQWISADFLLQVSNWILDLFTKENIEINMNLVNELKLKDMKIQLLQDQFQKKQQRKDYPEKNVIYILTTEDNKKKRIYIIGKANKLKNRLSSYNKTAEHEVIYYKECKDKEVMNLIEGMILKKLDNYREKANRDRFILPQEKDISFFISIINNAINYF